MAGSARYLVQRSSGFYARVVVPEALRTIVGKRELSAPVGAVTRAEAIRKLPAIVARLRHTIEAARTSNDAATPKAPRRGQLMNVTQLARAHYEAQNRFDEECRNSDPRYTIGAIDQNYADDLQRAISGSATNGELERLVGRIVLTYKTAGNTRVEGGTNEWREVARALAVAELESLYRTAERDEGDFSGQPAHPLLQKQPDTPSPAKDATAARIVGPDSSKTWDELLPTFLSERGASPSVQNEYNVAFRMFNEHLGEVRPVHAIVRADIQGFKRALGETPANYVKRFPGKSLPDAITANKKRATPFPLMSAVTVNDKYLSSLHSFFGWCVRSDILPDNPAAGIKAETKKDHSRPKRVPFSPDDLTRLFAPPLFASGQVWDETQWAMAISLFSGMRPSELAQVQLNSIRHERGVLVFVVEEETKNVGSQRIVPVHSVLIARGIEKRVKALRNAGETQLFPKWFAKGMKAKERAKAKDANKLTLNHYFPRFIPRRFNQFYLGEVGITDERKNFYTFRHTFKTGLARAGVDKATRDDLCGHKDYSAGAAYVHDISIEKLKAAVELLTFDGLNI